MKNSYASFESPYVKIISSWTNKKDAFILVTNMPVNTTAIIVLPANKQNKIIEDGIILENQNINYQNN
ncbi:alpha-L-rhamnosidase C-terminal domain-containing protein [Maribellus sediminis]|uniref:alpha-L-rhamnosidase C-terminal domain-containing protein n=1 Tax=Maribellus sediminis TaxID=2696285 RepID=UPI001430A880